MATNTTPRQLQLSKPNGEAFYPKVNLDSIYIKFRSLEIPASKNILLIDPDFSNSYKSDDSYRLHFEDSSFYLHKNEATIDGSLSFISKINVGQLSDTSGYVLGSCDAIKYKDVKDDIVNKVHEKFGTDSSWLKYVQRFNDTSFYTDYGDLTVCGSTLTIKGVDGNALRNYIDANTSTLIHRLDSSLESMQSVIDDISIGIQGDGTGIDVSIIDDKQYLVKLHPYLSNDVRSYSALNNLYDRCCVDTNGGIWHKKETASKVLIDSSTESFYNIIDTDKLQSQSSYTDIHSTAPDGTVQEMHLKITQVASDKTTIDFNEMSFEIPFFNPAFVQETIESMNLRGLSVIATNTSTVDYCAENSSYINQLRFAPSKLIDPVIALRQIESGKLPMISFNLIGSTSSNNLSSAASKVLCVDASNNVGWKDTDAVLSTASGASEIIVKEANASIGSKYVVTGLKFNGMSINDKEIANELYALPSLVFFDDIGGLHCNTVLYISDASSKTNIKQLPRCTDKLKLSEFDFIDSSMHSAGFIAQELEKDGYEWLVNTDDAGKKSVNYEAAFAIKISMLEQKILELQNEIDALHAAQH